MTKTMQGTLLLLSRQSKIRCRCHSDSSCHAEGIRHTSLSSSFHLVVRIPRIRNAGLLFRACRFSTISNIPSLYLDPEDDVNQEEVNNNEATIESEQLLLEGRFPRETIVALFSKTGATWTSLLKNRIPCWRAQTDEQMLATFESIIYFDYEKMKRARKILYEYDREMAMKINPDEVLLGKEFVNPTPCSKENEGPPPLYDDLADDDDDDDNEVEKKKFTEEHSRESTESVESENEMSALGDGNEPRLHRRREDVIEAIRNNCAVEKAEKKRKKKRLTELDNEDYVTSDAILKQNMYRMSLEEYDALLFLVAERLHFFFSDAIARQNRTIRTQFLLQGDGSIPLEKLLAFPSMQELTDSPKVLIKATKLYCADELVVNKKKDGIRRIVPFTIDKMKDNIPRSLFLFALPYSPKQNRYYTDAEEIRNLFCLTPILVTLRYRDERHPKTGKIIKRVARGSAVVEFEKVAEMERMAFDCLTRINGENVVPRRPLILPPRSEDHPALLVHAMKLSEYIEESKKGIFLRDSFRRPPGVKGEFLSAFGAPAMYK